MLGALDQCKLRPSGRILLEREAGSFQAKDIWVPLAARQLLEVVQYKVAYPKTMSILFLFSFLVSVPAGSFLLLPS